MNREEYRARLAEDFPFTAEELQPGGTVIFGIVTVFKPHDAQPIVRQQLPDSGLRSPRLRDTVGPLSCGRRRYRSWLSLTATRSPKMASRTPFI